LQITGRPKAEDQDAAEAIAAGPELRLVEHPVNDST